VTPEYNRSVPAVLKNALDIASRPYGQNVWAGKPAAVISQSIGALGGFRANHHLRQMLTFLDRVAAARGLYRQSADPMTVDGSFAGETTGLFLAKLMEKFAAWAARIRA
jgi:chromate reductase, NAD(P)H dehydrogenase (quinone)